MLKENYHGCVQWQRGIEEEKEIKVIKLKRVKEVFGLIEVVVKRWQRNKMAFFLFPIIAVV